MIEPAKNEPGFAPGDCVGLVGRVVRVLASPQGATPALANGPILVQVLTETGVTAFLPVTLVRRLGPVTLAPSSN